MTVPLLKATLIPIERRPGEQGEVTFSDPFIWSLVTFEDTKRKEDAVMVFSRGDLLVDLHGLMLGVLFLLAYSGGLAGPIGLRSEWETQRGLRVQMRRLKVGTVAMAVIAWLTVLAGTYLVYP
jgi:hypothetical protein